MIKVAIVGCNGKMGGFVARSVEESAVCETLFGVDAFGTSRYDFPVYKSFDEAADKPDVIVDFSNPAALDGMLGYALQNAVPCVICTTGYSAEQVAQIKKASEQIAVFYSGNMSLGINLLTALAKQAARVLGDSFDIEIVEKHHNLKVDAPSGTALMIADGISETLSEEPQYVYDRHAYRKKGHLRRSRRGRHPDPSGAEQRGLCRRRSQRRCISCAAACRTVRYDVALGG